MSHSKRIFLDTTPVIYYIQKNEIYFRTVKKIFYFLAENKADFIASDITTAESLVHAYRYEKTDWLNNFYGLMNLLSVEIFLTNDKRLKKFDEIRVITVDDFNFD